MNGQNKVMKIVHWKKNFLSLGRNGFFKWMPDRWYLEYAYESVFGKKLNLDAPRSFSEKLQWIKIYDRKPEYSILVDKYLVRDVIKTTIGEQYLIPLLGKWDNPEAIDFEKLPMQFVLKCNHDSGSVIICKDKTAFDKEKAKEKLRRHIKTGTYYIGREWPYKNIRPCIIAEQYMQDSDSDELKDYKFFCFNGKVEFFKIDFDRFRNHKANYYDIEGNLLPFYETKFPNDPKKELIIPGNLKKMISLAEQLADGHAFLRVDFYDIDNTIYFGEVTFFPASGFGKFSPNGWDEKIGDMIDLRMVEMKQ